MPTHKQHILTTLATNATISIEDHIISVNATVANITLYLPAISELNNEDFVINKYDSTLNTITLTPNGSDTILEDTSLVITHQNDSVRITPLNNTDWGIV